ncbi:hypothetical protein AVEN_143421-1 [Araneus ventricosus]|uniref:Uncharacterized protein n=1 Tax=Araneus ventricosus TaxID=182803 RepID=A0A4Y2AEC3_ARAVE|nr:hypothetical protein AVEN_143421-1 [Araneus ventricosus]
MNTVEFTTACCVLDDVYRITIYHIMNTLPIDALTTRSASLGIPACFICIQTAGLQWAMIHNTTYRQSINSRYSAQHYRQFPSTHGAVCHSYSGQVRQRD